MNDGDLKRISNLMDDKLTSSEQRILTEIGKFVEDQLLPAIEAKADKSDIDRLERKIDTISAQEMDQNQRLNTIESLPTIAHQLKKKK
ncbi:hypothetical protein HYS93_02975 [Candidatus Daviesbacteria bacterium]|nr:hypothetical protein [Candidatus Daviesbacteria bacterium]